LSVHRVPGGEWVRVPGEVHTVTVLNPRTVGALRMAKALGARLVVEYDDHLTLRIYVEQEVR
jgi:hypothetical protein